MKTSKQNEFWSRNTEIGGEIPAASNYQEQKVFYQNKKIEKNETYELEIKFLELRLQEGFCEW